MRNNPNIQENENNTPFHFYHKCYLRETADDAQLLHNLVLGDLSFLHHLALAVITLSPDPPFVGGSNVSKKRYQASNFGRTIEGHTKEERKIVFHQRYKLNIRPFTLQRARLQCTCTHVSYKNAITQGLGE